MNCLFRGYTHTQTLLPFCLIFLEKALFGLQLCVGLAPLQRETLLFYLHQSLVYFLLSSHILLPSSPLSPHSSTLCLPHVPYSLLISSLLHLFTYTSTCWSWSHHFTVEQSLCSQCFITFTWRESKYEREERLWKEAQLLLCGQQRYKIVVMPSGGDSLSVQSSKAVCCIALWKLI